MVKNFVYRSMPEAVMNKLLQKLACAPHEAVPFDVFKSGIFTCCVLQGNYFNLVTDGNTKLCCPGFVLVLFQSTTANKIDSEHIEVIQSYSRYVKLKNYNSK